MRYESKQALLTDIRTQHDLLCARLDDVPVSRHTEPSVWGDGWTLSDLVAHLAEWHLMFLRWYDEGLKGIRPAIPAPGYKGNQTPALNRTIWEKHRSRSAADVRADFEAGYRRIMEIVEALSESELLEPGHFEWTGSNPLRTYLGANTASHYRFALKVIERWASGRLRTADRAGH